ncbi:hypothetical protein FRC02_004335 [Tulasnella sp. 418]|nr:hypothetical protein FRC02_004335 [Tulasnella sp. 418]
MFTQPPSTYSGIHHLEEIKNAGLEVPSINQIELHPFCQQREIVDYCFQNQIVVQAYSPLTRGKRLDDETVEGIAKKHKKDPAQVLIRWSLQKGYGLRRLYHNLGNLMTLFATRFVSLPKSSSPERVLSNSQVYDFELDAQDMEALNGLDEGAAGATSWHPVTAP